jgi:hypothetical protein
MWKSLAMVMLLVVKLAAFSLFETESDVDRQYLSAIRDVKDIIITTQKTRGLTNNYMNGNVVAQLLVYGQRKEMKQHFRELEKVFASIEKLPAGYRAKATELMKRAKKLNKKAFRRKAAVVFDDYTAIIEDWMAFNQKIIDDRFRGKSPKAYLALRFQNQTLLPLTENIGKMRGMGSGIGARGKCRKEETPKMLSFADEIERYRDEMAKYLSKHPVVSAEQVKRVNEKIAAYVKLTKEKVIGKQKISLDPNKYFDQGTACISEVTKVYNAVSKTIDEAIAKER